MSFLARFVSVSSKSLENLSWVTVFPVTLSKKFMHAVWIFVHGYLRVRFDISSSINSRDIYNFPKLGPEPLLGSNVVPLDSTGVISY